MNKKYLFFLFLLSVCTCGVVSCNRNDNIFGGTLFRAKPKICCNIHGEQLHLPGGNPLDLSDLYVADSLLVWETSGKGDGARLFYVYSMADLSFSGSYITKGRGANELLSPIFRGRIKKDSENDFACIMDLSQCCVYGWDIQASIQGSPDCLCRICDLPPRTLSALPYRDSLFLAKMPLHTDFVYRTVDHRQQVYKEYSLYPEVSGIYDRFDKLSSADGTMPDGNKLAMAMCFFPQINMLDLGSGEKTAFAVTNSYKNWKKTIDKENVELTVYYESLCTTSDYIVALYHDALLMDWIQGKTPPHVHVFDWDGHFLYDIALNEPLRHIAVDENTMTMYGGVDDKLYRYDLSSILKTD